MTSQPSETRTVRNIYGVLRTVRSHGTYNYSLWMAPLPPKLKTT